MRRQYKERTSPVSVEKSTFLRKDPQLSQLQSAPALSVLWIDNSLNFIPYLPVDNNRAEEYPGGSSASEILSFLDESLSTLLKQKYHIFWSHVIFDPSLQKCLDTYLRFSRRSYDGGSSLSPIELSVFKKILKGIYITPNNPTDC